MRPLRTALILTLASPGFAEHEHRYEMESILDGQTAHSVGELKLHQEFRLPAGNRDLIVQNEIRNANGLFKPGQTCGGDAWSSIEILGFSSDRTQSLVRHSRAGPPRGGTWCPSGTLAFLPVGELTQFPFRHRLDQRDPQAMREEAARIASGRTPRIYAEVSVGHAYELKREQAVPIPLARPNFEPRRPCRAQPGAELAVLGFSSYLGRALLDYAAPAAREIAEGNCASGMAFFEDMHELRQVYYVSKSSLRAQQKVNSLLKSAVK